MPLGASHWMESMNMVEGAEQCKADCLIAVVSQKASSVYIARPQTLYYYHAYIDLHLS